MKMSKQNIFFLPVLILGLSAIITQLVIVREFLSIFSGNELVIGIILGNWMLIIGCGSYIGKYLIKHTQKLLPISQLIIGVVPIFDIFIIRSLHSLFFLQGELIGLVPVFISSFLLLLPYCFITGYLLVIISHLTENIGGTYSLDVLGDIIGGILFSFILIYFLNPFQVLFIVFIINTLVALYLSIKKGFKVWRNISIVTLLIGCMLIVFINLDALSTKIMFQGQEVVYQKTSLYGNIVVTKTNTQLSFFENGVPMFSTENTFANEETIHYPLLQHENPKMVLLIGGAGSGISRELQKYNVSIDYVELDKDIIDVSKKFTHNLDNVNIITQDGRSYIKTTKKTYDAIIVDLPPPTTAQFNRFYTAEFFSEAKKILNKQGIVSFSLGASQNYYSEEYKQLMSAEYNSLHTVFSNVLIIPGNNLYFIASDANLTYNYKQQLADKNITNVFVTTDYLKGMLTDDRISAVQSAISSDAINYDFKPISYYLFLVRWLRQFNTIFLWVIIGIIIILIAVLIPKKAVPFATFSAGFSGSAFTILLLIGYQIMYGAIYYSIGILVTAFMAGLFLGSFFINKIPKFDHKILILLELLLVIFSISLPYTIGIATKNAFVFLAILAGLLTGAVFPIAARLHGSTIHETAGIIFSADYFGACLGSLLIAAFFLPLFGLKNVALLIACLNLLSLALLLTKDQTVFLFKFIFTASVLGILGYLFIYQNQFVYNLSFHPVYIAVAGITLFVGLFCIFFNFKKHMNLFRIWSYIVFAIAVYYPLFRCYFKIPYIFCRNCPRKCIFGYFRPVLIPAAILQNVDTRFWCYNQCPIGTLQDAQCQKSLGIPRYIKYITRVAILAFIIFSIFVYAYTGNTGLFGSLFKNGFTVSVILLIIVGIILLISFFIKRFWCDYFCPVGTVSDFILKAEHKILKKP